MGINKFADWTPEEKQHLFGFGIRPKHAKLRGLSPVGAF